MKKEGVIAIIILAVFFGGLIIFLNSLPDVRLSGDDLGAVAGLSAGFYMGEKIGERIRYSRNTLNR
jgi:hypothetical protein